MLRSKHKLLLNVDTFVGNFFQANEGLVTKNSGAAPSGLGKGIVGAPSGLGKGIGRSGQVRSGQVRLG